MYIQGGSAGVFPWCLLLALDSILIFGLCDMKIKLKWRPLTCVWLVMFSFLSSQKSNLMFKRLDASTLPEDILSNTQTLPMMAHSAGSALWVRAPVQICRICSLCLRVCLLVSVCSDTGPGEASWLWAPSHPRSYFCSPSAPTLMPVNSRIRWESRTNMSTQPLIPSSCLTAVVLNLFLLFLPL